MTSTALGSIPLPDDTDMLARIAEYLRNAIAPLDSLKRMKKVTQLCTSDATLNDDDELLFPVEGGKDYCFEFHLLFDCPVDTVDANVAVGIDVTGALSWSVNGLALGGVDVQMEAVFHGDSTSTFPVGVTTNLTPAHIYGTFSPDSDGTVTLRWCQHSSSVNSLALKSGSYVRAEVMEA